jgi:hypothetical protein
MLQLPAQLGNRGKSRRQHLYKRPTNYTCPPDMHREATISIHIRSGTDAEHMNDVPMTTEQK